MSPLSSPVGRLRAIGLAEGLSFLVLLGVAMPLKYLAGEPLAVKVVGWAHGVLFIAYLAALGQTALTHRWSMFKVALGVIAALLPFGPFVMDRRLRSWASDVAVESGTGDAGNAA